MTRILRITSHKGKAQYLAGLSHDGMPVAWIMRTDIPSPYAWGPTHGVYHDPLRGNVIIVETAHKTYDVFRVPPTEPIFGNDDAATNAFMARKGAYA